MNLKPLFLLLFYCVSCIGTAKKQADENFKSPDGYDLNKPEKFVMPGELHEISGIAFDKGNSDSIYAEQDEAGKLYHFKLGDENLTSTKFGKKGDFEDVAICNNTVIMLRSDGVLFSFPLSEAGNKDAGSVQEWDNLLPQGEYEGLSADDKSNTIYALCKHCADDIKSRQTNGYMFKLNNDSLTAAGNFSIDVESIEKLSGETNIKFHPSALGKNPVTGEWYILSSVNKLLVIANPDWQVKQIFALNVSIFNQPEGIAFDKDGNLFISNEGGDAGGSGTVLKFKRSK